MNYLRTGYHIFRGISGVYIKLNSTPGGRAASGRLGTTVFFLATSAFKLFKK